MDYTLAEKVDELNTEAIAAISHQKQRLDQLEVALQRGNYGGDGGHYDPDKVEHKEAFGAFVRRGEEKDLADIERKALSVQVDPDGGYAVPEEIDGRIEDLLKDISPIRNIASVSNVGTSSLKILVNEKGTASGWVGETDGRTETDSPKLARVEIPAHEIYANPAASQKLLDDAGFDAETWLQGEVAEEFAVKEGAAFITGNGTGKPRGFLTYDISTSDDASRDFGTIQYLATGVSGDWPSNSGGDDGPRADKLIDFVHTLRPRYRANARWVMNSNTLATIRKFKDADGNPIFQPGLREGQPNRLLGFPITEAEDMPDIAADSLSVAFGDFQRGYRIVDRTGVRVLRDPFTNKPFVHFYTTKRVGGGLVNSEAIKLLKFSAS